MGLKFKKIVAFLESVKIVVAKKRGGEAARVFIGASVSPAWSSAPEFFKSRWIHPARQERSKLLIQPAKEKYPLLKWGSMHFKGTVLGKSSNLRFSSYTAHLFSALERSDVKYWPPCPDSHGDKARHRPCTDTAETMPPCEDKSFCQFLRFVLDLI